MLRELPVALSAGSLKHFVLIRELPVRLGVGFLKHSVLMRELPVTLGTLKHFVFIRELPYQFVMLRGLRYVFSACSSNHFDQYART